MDLSAVQSSGFIVIESYKVFALIHNFQDATVHAIALGDGLIRVGGCLDDHFGLFIDDAGPIYLGAQHSVGFLGRVHKYFDFGQRRHRFNL